VMKVLLSIKPQFAFKIFEGEKKFEFRKVIFKNLDVRTVIVYASSPVQQVIGEFEIDDIFSSSPNEIWELTKKHSGISELFFHEYFENRTIAHAIKIKNTKKYKKPLSLKEDFNVLPPQSYMYLKEELYINE
jgi:predicted transcriptional regulator